MGAEGSETRRRSEKMLAVIEDPLTRCGYMALPPWKIGSPGMITRDIVRHLANDALVVADLTGGNPNVFYELAIRHTMATPCIQVIEKGGETPFDIHDSRVIRVDLDDVDSVDKARKEIMIQIKHFEADPQATQENTVSVAIDLDATFGRGRSDKQLLSLVGDLKSAQQAMCRDIISEIKRSEQVSQMVREQFAKGIITYKDAAFRALRYDEKRGILYNSDEVAAEKRNILLNAETVKVILKHASHRKEANGESAKKGKSRLYEAGFDVSELFAWYFQQHVVGDIPFDLQRWLNAWKSYDSDAGMGHIEVTKANVGQGHSSDVRIFNSFLVHKMPRKTKEHESLCDFMVGYIEGLFRNMSPDFFNERNLDQDGITVTHKWKDCFLSHRNPEKGCLFHVHVPEATERGEDLESKAV